MKQHPWFKDVDWENQEGALGQTVGKSASLRRQATASAAADMRRNALSIKRGAEKQGTVMRFLTRKQTAAKPAPANGAKPVPANGTAAKPIPANGAAANGRAANGMAAKPATANGAAAKASAAGSDKVKSGGCFACF